MVILEEGLDSLEKWDVVMSILGRTLKLFEGGVYSLDKSLNLTENAAPDFKKKKSYPCILEGRLVHKNHYSY